MNILLFGTGDYYQRYKAWFSSASVLALLDNDASKWGTRIDGHIVLSPQEVIKLSYDRIFILSAYYDEMEEQLLSLGVPMEKISTQFDLRIGMHGIIERPIIRYNSREKGKKVYFFFYDLHRNGASVVFSYAVMLMQKYYPVCVVALEDGPLREYITDMGIEVIIDPNVQLETLTQSHYEKTALLFFCNTFNFFHFLQQRDTNIPAVWWLHDPEFYYHSIGKASFDLIPKENLYLYAVSPIAADAFKKYCDGILVEKLPYGLPDERHCAGENHHREGRPVFFAIVGHLQYHKAQDVYLKAIKSLSENAKNNSRFLIIGNDNTLFAKSIKEMADEMENIIFTGEMSLQQLYNLYEKTIDVLVCPSRMDSLPTVAAEAMMHNVPCIVSDKTGTAAHIHNGVDGWVVPSEDVKALSLKMEEIISHPEQIRIVGEKAREVYEIDFSIGSFEKRLRQVLSKCLPNV